MAVLKIVGASDVSHHLAGEVVTIGRGAANAIALSDSACSSRHAQFLPDGAGWRIEDRGSLNGTYVNGERTQSARLANGDRIQLGSTELIYESQDAGRDSSHASSFLQSILAEDTESIRPAADLLGRSLMIDDAADENEETRFEMVAVDSAKLAAASRSSERSTLVLGPAVQKALAPEPSAPAQRLPGESLAEVKLRLIQQVSEKLVRIFDPKTLMDEILTIVMRQTGANRGLLCLLNDERLPVPIAASGVEEGKPVRVSRTALNMVLERRSGVLIQQGIQAADMLRSLAEMQIYSTLCVPLWTGNDIVGILSLDSTQPTRLFTEEDLELLLAVAHQAAIGIERGRLSQMFEAERQVRGYLSKYLDNRIVEQIARRAAGADPLAPAERIVTVLFSDIVSFTKICEGLAPVEVAEFIGKYLTAMTEIVFAHGGTIDKYIGDALMALFGAPLPDEQSAVSAVRTALDMRDRIRDFPRPAGSKTPLRVRFGINTGSAVVGNIGSTRRLEYTAIGDAVNIAARLQTFARPNEICIDETTRQKIDGAFVVEEIGTIDVRNRSEPVAVFKVLRAK